MLQYIQKCLLLQPALTINKFLYYTWWYKIRSISDNIVHILIIIAVAPSGPSVTVSAFLMGPKKENLFRKKKKITLLYSYVGILITINILYRNISLYVFSLWQKHDEMVATL